MSETPRPPDMGDTIRVYLTKTDEADAMIDSLDGRDDVSLEDKGAYWMIEGQKEIAFDPEEVSDLLGRTVTLEDLLVTFATFAGRVDASTDRLVVTSEFPQMVRRGDQQ
jgi:hypothetical protein